MYQQGRHLRTLLPFRPRAIWRLRLKARARSRSYTLHYTTALAALVASHRPVFSHHTTNHDTLNSVNGASNNSKGTSLGTDDHVRQVILDRHQVTACNSNRNKIKVGTWNVRPLYQAGKLENVIQEMGRLDVNIF